MFVLKSGFSSATARYIRSKLRSTKDDAEVALYRKLCAISKFCFCFKTIVFFSELCDYLLICFHRRSPPPQFLQETFCEHRGLLWIFGTTRLFPNENVEFFLQKMFLFFPVGKVISEAVLYVSFGYFLTL